ncbi:hypothetical protein DRQ15_06600 [candidate division KSB1 bacterium]|nr:MAG: hypothetical protein DRQ15_06600 [candidate division KSB1 bacterium]
MFNCKHLGKAITCLDNSIAEARASGVILLRRFANTLAAHRTGILNYLRYRINAARPSKALTTKSKSSSEKLTAIGTRSTSSSGSSSSVKQSIYSSDEPNASAKVNRDLSVVSIFGNYPGPSKKPGLFRAS